MKTTMRQKTALLLQLIAEKAATPGGFFTADARAMQSEKNAAKQCRKQVEDGTLFRERVNQKTFGYFATQALANAYMSQHRGALLAKTASNMSFAPKADKPCRAVEIIRPAHIKTQVYLTPQPRNQVVPLPAFIHGGMGQMRA
jgi:hypothetical protein